MSETNPCPCGSGKEYPACCEYYITGERNAPTAEALMRARYSAYVRTEIEFLCETLHPKHRDDHDEKVTREWSESSEWLGLQVLATEEGTERDEYGTVEFIATYAANGRTTDHHEIARFAKDKGIWYFVEGQVISRPYVRETPKIGRNDPCPCGSGKKCKKCCSRLEAVVDD